jgi:crossover junction endodeoxyribonuclease RuvC
MRIIGIDPGTATVGWGITDSDNGEITVVSFGHISTSKNLPLEKRLLEIADDIRALLEKFQPQEASVEELFFFNNQKTAIAVAQARGVILLTLERFGVRIGSYTPLQVKQALTNYGRADKQQVQTMVKVILKLSTIPKPDDAADALALAICHTHRRKIEAILES